MTVPNAQHAIIAPAKIAAYLLNLSHKRGGPKARLLLASAIGRMISSGLESDLRTQHLRLDVGAAAQTLDAFLFRTVCGNHRPIRYEPDRDGSRL